MCLGLYLTRARARQVLPSLENMVKAAASARAKK
jgi:hypothetical protein